MLKDIRNKKGITLVALIITVIVMLILAGISLNALIGDNGLITNAQAASFKSSIAKYLEDTQTYLVSLEAANLESENGYPEGAKKYFYAGDTSNSGNLTYKTRFLDVSTLMGADKIQNTEWEVFTQMKDPYHRSHLAVEEGNLTWFAESEDEDEINWCLQLGLKVFVIGKGYKIDSGGYQVGSSGSYSNTVGDGTEIIPSGIWCNAPDLSTGWNTGATYYVTYSSLNENGLPTDLIYNDAPAGWYDYGAQKWANIATVSHGLITYWTWIPRYMVKANSITNEIWPTEGTTDVPDIKFVSTSNEWQDAYGNTMSESDLIANNYILPDAFTFNGTQLAGIWVAKYEISNPAEVIGFGVKSSENSITITSLTFEGDNFSSDPSDDVRLSKLDIYVNGSIYSYTDPVDGTVTTGSDVTLGSEGFVIKGLAADREYTIKVVIKSKYMKELDLETTKTVKTTKGGMKSNPDTEHGETDIVTPDLTGFSQTNTYYATINSSNQIIKGNPISENPPEDWYDYENQKWANIMTLNTGSTAGNNSHNGEMAIWVWIPRYEYKVDTTLKTVDTVFIPPTQTSADSGYTIPDAFKFNGESLKGIWVAKYEISDPRIPDGLTLKNLAGGFKIMNIIYTGYSSGGSEPNGGTITIKNSSDAVVTGYNNKAFNVGDSITGLTAGKYTITVSINRSFALVGGTEKPITFEQTIYVSADEEANAPDLSGFAESTNYIYYVMYDNVNSDGKVGKRVIFKEKEGSSTEYDIGYYSSGTTFVKGTPSGWYDYNNNKYANIIISDTELTEGTICRLSSGLPTSAKITMWVWIPRYQFKVDKNAGASWVSGTADASSDAKNAGYYVPDGFKFGDEPLTGIWVGKYEITE